MDTEKISLSPLLSAMNGNKELVKEIADLFLQQAPQDLLSVSAALDKNDFEETIKTVHHMKSTVSIFGTSNLWQILNEMEELGKLKRDLPKIKSLHLELIAFCNKAFEEIKSEL